MKHKMNLITLLVFLYAGIVCSVVKPETRSGIVKNESKDSLLVPASTVFDNEIKGHQKVPKGTLLVLGIR